jgi:hypothetical protein
LNRAKLALAVLALLFTGIEQARADTISALASEGNTVLELVNSGGVLGPLTTSGGISSLSFDPTNGDLYVLTTAFGIEKFTASSGYTSSSTFLAGIGGNTGSVEPFATYDSPAAVPEPSSLTLALTASIVGLGYLRFRRPGGKGNGTP